MDCFIATTIVFAKEEINRDALESVSGSILDGDDPAWNQLYVEVMDTCIALIKELKHDDIVPKAPFFCSPKELVLLKCVVLQSILNCPANSWTESMDVIIQYYAR